VPIHDWTRVPDGIFHHFHHCWIDEIQRALNGGLLPEDCYALAEQLAGGFGPDVLALQTPNGSTSEAGGGAPPSPGVAVKTQPQARRVGVSDMKGYKGRQNTVVVRHASGDRILAFVEIVSPGNKAARKPFSRFVEKAAEAVDRGYHLLIIDVLPPTERDPQGIHGAVWAEIEDDSWRQPADKPLTFAAYESCSEWMKVAYVENVAVGEACPEMPLFLWPDYHVDVPLEATCRGAYQSVPLRWRRVLEGESQAG
jgi:hypothetical protein